ncbi:MAG: PilZ domain-containing protein [Desulfobacterales bacterium]
MGEADRRSSVRVPGKYEINFINEGDYLISYSKDISVDGMFIQTESAPAVGELTKLTFSIGNVEKVSVDAKVVWVNDSESSEDPGMGVQFVKPPKKLKETILALVKKVAVLERSKAK